MVATVHKLRPSGSPERPSSDTEVADAALVSSLLAGHPDAPAKLFDRYGAYVEKLLVRLLGRDPEVEDLLHEVFAEVLDHVGDLRDPKALRAWITRITVFTARTCIRRRTRSRWLIFRAPEDIPEPTATERDHDEAQETIARVYRALHRMKPDERIPFVLHELHEMSLPETADACSCSVATAKRRIARARIRFMMLIGRDDGDGAGRPEAAPGRSP